MIQMKNISILRGTCSTDRYDLPRNDDEVDKFQCGSNSLEVMYYIWLGILVTPVLLFLLLWLFRDSIALSRYIDVSSIISTTMKYWNVRQYIDQSRDVSMMKNFRNYLNFSNQILRFTLVFSLYIIIVLLPTYAILGSYMNRVSYSYAWLFSIAFQSGRLSFVILMTLLMLLIIALIPVCESFFVTDHDIVAFRSFSSSMVVHYDPRKDVGSYRKLQCIWCIYLLCLFASIIFLIGAYISYVYVTLYQRNDIILSSQIVVPCLKAFWTHVILPMMSRSMIYFSSTLNISTVESYRSIFLLQYCVILLVNIIIPCAALAAVSPKCFYYLFNPESAIQSSFQYDFCILFDFSTNPATCINNVQYTELTSYQPPFIYSYECSIGLIRTFSTVLIFNCILSTFINPIAQIMWSSIIIFPHRHSYTDGRSIISPIFDVNQQVLTDLSFVALLLTFGAVFPPLAVVIMFCIVLRNITTRIHMGKVVIDYIDSDDDIKLSIIEEECGDLPSLRDIRRYGWIVIFYSKWVFLFFLI